MGQHDGHRIANVVGQQPPEGLPLVLAELQFTLTETQLGAPEVPDCLPDMLGRLLLDLEGLDQHTLVVGPCQRGRLRRRMEDGLLASWLEADFTSKKTETEYLAT